MPHLQQTTMQGLNQGTVSFYLKMDKRHFLLSIISVLLVLPQILSCPPDPYCTCWEQRDIYCNSEYSEEFVKVPEFHQDNVTYDLLNLGQNRLKRIPARAFKNVRVRTISIVKNQREELDIHRKAFRGTEKYLEKLEIRDSGVAHLPPKLFRKMKRLSHVDFSNNRIMSIRLDAFDKAFSIINLNLSMNSIKSLQPGTFKSMRKLRSLDLNSNEISFMDSDSFIGLSNLQTLRLDSNMIRDLQPRTFAPLEKLTSLDLHDNEIPALFPIMFTGMKSLETLVLKENPLLFIFDDAFGDMAMLQTLDLSNTQLTFLNSGMFKGLSQLHTLKLFWNNITNLANDVFMFLPSLKEIELNSNRLKTINPCAFRSLSKMKLIQARSNPIACTCDLQWTLQRQIAEIDATCSFPVRLLDKKVGDAENYSKCKGGVITPMCHFRYDHHEEMSNAIELIRRG